MEGEALRRPFSFSVGLRNVNLGVKGENEKTRREFKRKKNLSLPKTRVGKTTGGSIGTKIPNMKESSQRLPSKPAGSQYLNAKSSRGRQPHRISNFYKVRGYDVSLRSTAVREASHRAEAFQQPVRPNDSRNDSVSRGRKRADSIYRSRQQYDVVPVSYTIGKSQEEHTKRNRLRRRPHTMMQQSRPRDFSDTLNNYNEQPEVNISDGNIDLIEARLSRASIYVGWGTSSVLMQKVVSRPSTALQAPTSPITYRDNKKAQHDYDEKHNVHDDEMEHILEDTLDEQQQQKQTKEQDKTSLDSTLELHEDDTNKIIVPQVVASIITDNEDEKEKIENDDDNNARIVVRVKPETASSTEDNINDLSGIVVKKDMDANIDSKEEKANDIGQFAMGQNQRNTKDVSETESQSPSKGDTVEDLHLEHKLNNVENKGNSDIGGESSHASNMDVDVASLSTKTKIEVTVAIPMQENEPKNIGENEEFQDMAAWNQNDDIVAVEMRRKQSSALNDINTAKPTQEMSDVFESYHHPDKIEDSVQDEIAEQLAPEKVEDEIVEVEEETVEESDHKMSQTDDTVNDKIDISKDVEVMRAIAESEQRVQAKHEQEEAKTDKEPAKDKEVSVDETVKVDVKKEKESIVESIHEEENVLEKDEHLEENLIIIGSESEDEIKEIDALPAEEVLKVDSSEPFPVPDIGVSELLSSRQAADVLGYSTAIFDEIEKVSIKSLQVELKNDPPSPQVCFENALKAEEDTKIDEAIVWYSLSYGLELDIFSELNGPNKSSKFAKYKPIYLQAEYALRSLLRRGELYQSMGCLKQALWDFTRASLLSPQMLVCDYHLAMVETECHSLKKALTTVEKCLTEKILPHHDPNFISSLWTCKAEILHQRSEHGQALEAIKKALELDPQNWKAYKMRGLWLSSIKTINILNKPDSSRISEAFEDYHNVLDLHPQDAESVEHMVDIAIHGNNRDILLKCLTQIDMVISNLKAAVKNFDVGKDANCNEWITGNGWTIGSTKKIPMEEDIAHTYCQRARLYAFLGHVKEAKEDLDIAAMLDSEHPQVFLYRGALSHPEDLVDMAKKLGHGIEISTTSLEKNSDEVSQKKDRSAKNSKNKKKEAFHHDAKSNIESKKMHSLKQLNIEEQHAIHDLSKCLDLYPESFDALLLRASIYLREDMYSAALHDLKEAAMLDENSGDVLKEIARINLQHFHDFDAAIDATTAIITNEPQNSDPYFLRAEAYTRNGHFKEAINDYGRLIKLDPSNPWPYLYRGKILANLNRGRLAIYDYISFCKFSVQTPEIQAKLGQGYMLLNDFEDAISLLRKAVENQDTVYNLCILGDALMEAGDVSGALQVLSQAVSRDPNNVLGHTTLGHCHMRMGQYKSAISCYNHAVNLDPTNPMTYNNRGVCKTLLKHNQLKDEMEREKKRLRKMSMIGGGPLLDDYDDFSHTAKTSRRRKKKKKRSTRKKKKGRKGRGKKKKNVWRDLDDIGLAKKYDTLVGLEDFNKSLSIDKKYADARLNRAEMYLLAKRNQKALHDLNIVIEHDPKCNSAYINRGVLHCANGRYAAAIRDFDIALEIDDEHALSYFNRGVAYSFLGDYRQAIDDYNRSLTLAPTSIAALRNRGLLYLRDGNYELALKDLENLIESVEDTPQEHQHSDLISAIAHCELHSNRLIPDAIQAFNDSIEAHPDAVEAHIGRGNVYLKLALRDEPMPSHLVDFGKVSSETKASVSLNRSSNLMSQHEKDIFELNLQYEGIQARSNGFKYWLNLAQKDFGKALKLDPYQVEARANIAFTLYVQGKFRKALSVYNGALKMFPNHRKALEGRSLVYMALKQYKKAYDDITAAMEDEDSNAIITNILEMIRVRKAMGGSTVENDTHSREDHEERRARTLKNIERECDCLVTRSLIRLKMANEPESSASPSLESCNDLLHAIEKGEKYNVACYTAYYNYGTLLLRNNKISKAIEMFSKCISSSPDPYYLAYINRGIAYGVSMQYDKAFSDFDYVLKEQPSNIHLLYNRAVLHKLNGNLQDALSDLNCAIMYSPDDAQLYSERGRIYSAQNKMQMAMVDFAIALQLDEFSV